MVFCTSIYWQSSWWADGWPLPITLITNTYSISIIIQVICQTYRLTSVSDSQLKEVGLTYRQMLNCQNQNKNHKVQQATWVGTFKLWSSLWCRDVTNRLRSASTCKWNGTSIMGTLLENFREGLLNILNILLWYC